MSGKPWVQAERWLRQPSSRALLAPPARRVAPALIAVCVAVTVFLGAHFSHQGRPDWLDRAIDHRIRHALGWHHGLLELITSIGDPVPVTVMTAALVVACLATRRWHGAALLAVAVPVAAALTEIVLKPLIDRTIQGALSFPSGHTTGMFALVGCCAVLLAGPSHPRLPAGWRVLIVLAAYLVATAVAVALIGVGAHYFTDTVAGAAVGTATVLLTALILDRLGRPGPRPESQAGQPAPANAGRHLSPASVRTAGADHAADFSSPAPDTTRPGRPARR
jgi:membrane-associated phospholipid phosphatase